MLHDMENGIRMHVATFLLGNPGFSSYIDSVHHVQKMSLSHGTLSNSNIVTHGAYCLGIGNSDLQIEEGRVIMDGKLMSTVVWSLAIFRAFESPLYDGILRSVKQCDIRDFDQESVRRLYQVYVLSGLYDTSAGSLPEPMR